MNAKLSLLSVLAIAMLAGCKEPTVIDTPEPTPYDISVTAPENGSIAVTADGAAVEQALAGTTITIAATPNEGYEFVAWTVTGATPAAATATTTTFTMPESNVTVAAEFALIPPVEYNITVTVAMNIGGTATASVTTAAAGTEITLTATPDEGYQFAQWYPTGVTLPDETANPATFTMPEGDVSIMAAFALLPPPVYSITVTAGTGGTATASLEEATEGAFVTLTATANEGYNFVSWTVTGATLTDPAANPATFMMPAGNVTAEAEFAQDPALFDAGVMMGSVKWATRNVDRPGRFAATPRSSGMYYQWNRRTAWSTTNPPVSYTEAGENTSPTWDNSNATGDSWVAENDPCPKGWRLPTNQEQLDLKNGSTGSLEAAAGDDYQATKFTDKVSGNTIFFPNVGGRNSTNVTTLYSQGTTGFYWSATITTANNANYFYLYGATIMNSNSARYGAYSVRCVAKSE